MNDGTNVADLVILVLNIQELLSRILGKDDVFIAIRCLVIGIVIVIHAYVADFDHNDSACTM